MAALRGDAVYRSASFFRRSPLALGRWLPTFRAMVAFAPLKNSHSRTISRRMPAHVGAGVPANINKHRGLSPHSYDVALGRCNHLYSVAALTNGAGSVVERYRYDTYGQRTVLAPDGITTRAVSSYNQQVGFTGRYLDKETGLWYYRTRMYSAQLGRFISRDEQEYRDGFDLYASFFVPNDTDPFGEQGWHKQALGGPVGNTDLLDSGITCECQDCPCPPNKKGTQKVVCKAAPQFDIQIDVDKLNKMNLKGWTVNTAYNHEKQHVDSVTAEIQKIVKERNDDETSCISASSCKTRASNAEKSLKGKVPAIKDKESKHSNPGSPKDGVPGAETPADKEVAMTITQRTKLPIKYLIAEVVFVFLFTAILTGGETGIAAANFAKSQLGIVGITSTTVDTFAGMGNQAFLVIAVGAKGKDEALQIVGNEADGFTLVSRSAAIAGLILLAEEGVEYEQGLLADELRVVLKSLPVEIWPRSVRIVELKTPNKNDHNVLVGEPAEYNLIVQGIDKDKTVNNFYYYMSTEGGVMRLVKVGSWKIRIIL
jgi:RHS repeat-associated protein